MDEKNSQYRKFNQRYSAFASAKKPEDGYVTVAEVRSEMKTAKEHKLDELNLRTGELLFPPVVVPRIKSASKSPNVLLSQNKPSLLQYATETLQRLVKRRKITNVTNIGLQETKDHHGSRHVVAFAWHPFLPKFAVALADDTIRFYVTNTTEWEDISLTHKLQVGISNIQWNPLGGNRLAVECSTGIAVWSFRSHRSEKSARMFFLQRNYHTRPTCLDWSPCGRFIAHAEDSRIVIWDVAKAALPGHGAHPLPSVGLSKIRLLRWSPRGNLLFSSCKSSFQVWRARDWTHEVWDTRAPITAACWNYAGNILLVAEENNSLIHTVNFQKSAAGLESEGPLDVSQPNGKHVGGTVRDLHWCPTSDRLIVSFNENDLIAVFDTSAQSMPLTFWPIGFIQGPSSPPTKSGLSSKIKTQPEGKMDLNATQDSDHLVTDQSDNTPITSHPIHMHFHPRFDMEGTLLAICWSHGWVSLIPMYFRNHVEVTRRPIVETVNDAQTGLTADIPPPLDPDQGGEQWNSQEDWLRRPVVNNETDKKELEWDHFGEKKSQKTEEKKYQNTEETKHDAR